LTKETEDEEEADRALRPAPELAAVSSKRDGRRDQASTPASDGEDDSESSASDGESGSTEDEELSSTANTQSSA